MTLKELKDYDEDAYNAFVNGLAEIDEQPSEEFDTFEIIDGELLHLDNGSATSAWHGDGWEEV